MSKTPTSRHLVLGVAVLGLALSGGAASADLSESRTLKDSFEIAPGGRVAVDNVFGSITVTGTLGNRVEMSVVETIEAEDREALERAKREVELDVDSSDALLDLFVDGPFRDRHDRNRWSSRHRRPGYQVHYDFELRVPNGVSIALRTVTDGEIHVTGVHGNFEVSNVNGGIEMRGLEGWGRVQTVNGPIKLDFASSPGSTCEFETVNGNVDVAFPPDLSADLRLTTRWGQLWSEFEVSPLAAPPAVRKTQHGKTIIKSEGSLVRVAGGGPKLSFETLNGDVLIRRHDRGERR